MDIQLNNKQPVLPYNYSAFQHNTTQIVSQPGYDQYPGQNATTTIVINQPGFQNNSRDWSSGLCQCCDDMESCCCVTFCNSCYLCKLYQRHDEPCCTPLFVPMSDLFLRVQHRNRQRIRGTILNECFLGMWCGPCMTCQLKRDMDFVEQSGGKLTF